MGKRIVIIGAGFGGLRAALVLGKKIGNKNEVVLVDKQSHHTFTPLLYEVATTSKETANYIELHEVVNYEISGILKGLPVKFVQKKVESIDALHGDIHLGGEEKIKYDYLLIAMGSETNFFDIPGLKEYALEFKTFNDALKIRDSILEKFSANNQNIKIVIGGGGSTGVELAAEIQNWLPELKKDFKECDSQTTIVQGGPTVLSSFSPRVIGRVTKRLNKLGVNLVLNEIVVKATENKIQLKSGKEIDFDVFVWAGGVKANSTIRTMPLKLENKGRSEVSEHMNCITETPELKLHGKIYGIGDLICFSDSKGNSAPMVARAAISQANVAVKNIISEINNLEPKHTYHTMNYPYIIPLGGKHAVTKIGPICFAGLSGWLFKGVVELNYLLSIMPFPKAMRIWIRGLKIFIQNDRLG